jgi:hypothetical protein
MLLSRLLIYSLPFTAWFAFGPWLRLPVVLILTVSMITPIILVIKKSLSIYFSLADFLLFLFLMACVVSATINADHLVQKDYNNIFAFLFIVVAMYNIPKIYFHHTLNKTNINHIYRAINQLYLIVVLVVLLDFFLKNSTGFEMYNLFVFKDVGNASYFIRNGSWTPAGPAEEPATTAFFITLLFFLTLAYNKKKNKIIGLYFLLQVSVMFALGSSATLAFFILSLFIATFLSLNKKAIIRLFVVLSFFLVISPWIIQYLNDISFFDKLLMNSDNKSAMLRMESWILFYNSLFDGWQILFFGHSPAFSKLVVITGFHSSYFTIVANFGLLAFSLFSLFLIIIYMKYIKEQNIFVNAAFLIIIFNNAIGDYYYQPIVWISILIIMFAKKYQNSLEKGIYIK